MPLVPAMTMSFFPEESVNLKRFPGEPVVRTGDDWSRVASQGGEANDVGT